MAIIHELSTVGSSAALKIALPLATFVVVVVWVAASRGRYPDAPWLRVSKKPSILGMLEDRHTYLYNPMAILNVGWEKYSRHGINYMLDTAEGPRYIVAHKYFDELTRAPDTHISAMAASNMTMQLESTLHKSCALDQYHFDLPIKKSLTQALGPKLIDIVEEGKLALNEFVGPAKDWTPINGMKIALNAVTRTANRLLFNIELTRNPEFHQLSITYSFVMFGGADKVRKWPSFLKPIVMWLSTDIYQSQRTARKHLMPFIERRLQEEKAARAAGTSKTRQKEDDMIQWVMDYTSDKDLVPDLLFYRMLHINVSAVHTSSASWADIAYTLCIFPQYQDELREEIIQIFRQEDGWSKQTLTFLAKMDSFMTECARLLPNGTSKNFRYALRDWAFKDGTKVPKGTYLLSNQIAYQYREEVFPDPLSFDPWRMYKKRTASPEEMTKHQYVMTGDKNLHFGHGKHACPGRFFAANEIKALLVLFLMRYDMRLSKESNVTWEEIKQGVFYSISRLPAAKAIIEFKDRTHRLPEDTRKWFV